MTSAVDRLTGWTIDRWAFARKRAQAAKASPSAEPRRLAADFLERQGLLGSYQGETMDVDGAMRLAATSAWAFSDIQLIANRVASAAARPEVKRRVGEELEDLGNHPLELLLARPNPLMTGSFLLRYVTWWFSLYGNAYVFVATAQLGRGGPEELWPLVAPNVTPLTNTLHVSPATGRLTINYEYMVNGQVSTLPGEHVIHFRTANPWDFWRGLSPLTAGLLAIEGDKNRGKWSSDFFGVDNALPTAVISLPETVGEADFLRARDEIREEFGGRRRTAITRAGDMKIETIQQTLQEMQLLEGREFSRKEIDRVYGVPEGLISGGLSGDSRLAAETGFAVNTVQPLIDYMAEEWTDGLGPFYAPEELVLVAPNVVPRDKALAVQEYQIKGQDRTINENRAEQGLAPVDHPLADVPVRLLNMRTDQPGVGSLTGSDAPGNVAANEGRKTHHRGAEGAEGERTGGEARAEASDPAEPDPAVVEGMRVELRRWRAVALKSVKAGRDPSERAFESEVLPAGLVTALGDHLRGADEAAVRSLFETAQVHLPAALVALESAKAEGDPLARAKAAAEALLRRIFGEAHDDLGEIEAVAAGQVAPANAFGQNWLVRYGERLRSHLVPALSTAATAAAQEIAGSLGISWELVNQAALSWAQSYSYSWVSGLEQTTQAVLQDTISQWMASGEHLDVLTSKLTAVFNDPERAEKVASTETTRLFQLANEAAWRQANAELDAGIVGGTWQTAVDDIVCLICLPLHGATRSLESPGYLHPDTGELVIMPAHVKCRCYEKPRLTPVGSRRPGPV